jgi:hypothetical protein
MHEHALSSLASVHEQAEHEERRECVKQVLDFV